MGLFSKILNKLGINKDKTGATTAASTSKPAEALSSAKAPVASTSFSEKRAAPKESAGEKMSAQKESAVEKRVTQKESASKAIPEVDVLKKFEELGSGKGLNWKVSIVDLLKLLDLDSSREARNELATELGCPADLMNDSAKMNVWLHKTVLKKIAENGGNIPKDLLS